MAKRPKDEAQDEARRMQALGQVRQFPDPVLKQPARDVESFDEDLDALAQRMIGLMHDAHGAGLAAPQLGLMRRLFVYVTPEGEELALVNPEIVEQSDERDTDGEGCLSLALLIDLGHEVPVERSLRIRLRARDTAGNELERLLEGREARVVQHELDHLEGTLILDRTTAEARREAMRLLRGALT
jgi:peptide deformylase